MYIHTTRLHKHGLSALGLLTLTVLSVGCGPAATPGESAELSEADGAPGAPQDVALGVEVLLRDSLHLVAGKRVGLLTNHTGQDRNGTATIDLLAEHPDVDLVALFSPEHGIRGSVEAGVKIDSSTDSETGLPIFSLYGDTRKPTPEMLEGVEVMVFDIQDIGTRYYTYLPSMVESIEAAGEAGIPFVVLDRPNPIGGAQLHGNILDPDLLTFVGRFPMPMRHGLTAGEFAVMAVEEYGIVTDLTVVPMNGWDRTMFYEDTGLPWRAPSPNMPTVESALHYPGTCLFEGTNISVGRGTDIAFQQIGAPWIDADDLALRLAAYDLPDAVFVPITFTPENAGDGKFSGEEVQGVKFVSNGPDYDPTLAALAALVETRAMSGDQWTWYDRHFDRLIGDASLRGRIEAGESFQALSEGWGDGLSGFEALRGPHLLYP